PEVREVQLVWFYGRLAFTPIGALAGGVYGNFSGVSAKKARRAEPGVLDALEQVQIPQRFEPLLLALVREKVPGVVLLTNRLPHETTFPTPSLMDTVAPLPPDLQAFRRSRSDVRAFEGAEVAVVLRVINWGLSGREGSNKPLSVSFVVKGTVIDA